MARDAEVFQLVPQDRNTELNLPQILVSVHPEMTRFSVIKQMHFQRKAAEKQRAHRLSLPHDQNVLLPVFFQCSIYFSLVFLLIRSRQLRVMKNEKALWGMVPLPNDFIGLVTLEFVGLFQLIVAFLSAFDADGNVSF